MSRVSGHTDTCSYCEAQGYHKDSCTRPNGSGPAVVLRKIVERASGPFPYTPGVREGLHYVKVPVALIEEARELLKLPK